MVTLFSRGDVFPSRDDDRRGSEGARNATRPRLYGHSDAGDDRRRL